MEKWYNKQSVIFRLVQILVIVAAIAAIFISWAIGQHPEKSVLNVMIVSLILAFITGGFCFTLSAFLFIIFISTLSAMTCYLRDVSYAVLPIIFSFSLIIATSPLAKKIGISRMYYVVSYMAGFFLVLISALIPLYFFPQ